MRIVLDTGVLWKPAALALLEAESGMVILPAAAYAERIRQILRDGRSAAELDALLEGAEIVVEPMGRAEVDRYVPLVARQERWRTLAFDALIAGHVEPGDRLWTTNPRHFEAIGVPREQIVAIE